MKLKNIITEGGDEVEYDSLDKKQQYKINAVQKVIGGKRLYVMETIHGFIVAFDSSRHMGGNKSVRFNARDLDQISKLKVRWLDVSPAQQSISVAI